MPILPLPWSDCAGLALSVRRHHLPSRSDAWSSAVALIADAAGWWVVLLFVAFWVPCMTFLRTILGHMVSPSVHLSFHPLFFHPPPFPKSLSIGFRAGGERERKQYPKSNEPSSLLLNRVWVAPFSFFPCSSCWFAIHLQYSNVCSISYPDYLTSPHLTRCRPPTLGIPNRPYEATV